jgi:hypothetical protein
MTQAREIEGLKAAHAHARAVHKQEMDEARTSEQEQAAVLLEETKRLHSLELQVRAIDGGLRV